MILSGVLFNACGPMPDITVKLEAQRTTLNGVVYSAECFFTTQEDGSYYIDLEPGYYTVSWIERGRPVRLGSIVADFGSEMSLPEALEADFTPAEPSYVEDALAQMQAALTDAEQARDTAQAAASTAAADVSDMLTQAVAESADRAEQEADRANTFADNAGYVTRERLRKQATLDLDFASGDYAVDTGEKLRTTNAGEVLTVERATPKWVFGPNGKLREVPPNTLARQWNPATGEPEGVLIEESRTNLLLWSGDLTNAAWIKSDEPLWEYSVGAKPSPISGVNFSKFYVPQDVTNETSLYYRFINTVVDSNYVFSFIVSKDYNLLRHCQIDGGSGVRSVFDIDTGTFTIINPDHTVGVNDLGDSWLVWVSFVAASDTERVGVMPQEVAGTGYNKDFTAGGYQYTTGFQLEEGSTPSSYIPTTDSPVTRAADNVSRELGSEYNPNEGTVIVECDVEGIRRRTDAFATAIASWGEPGRANTFVLFSSGTDRDSLNLRIYGAVGLQSIGLGNRILDGIDAGRITVAASYNASTGEVVISALGQSTSATWSFAGYSQNDAEFLLNKLGAKGDTTQSSSLQLYRDARYIPRALTEAELIELTS